MCAVLYTISSIIESEFSCKSETKIYWECEELKMILLLLANISQQHERDRPRTQPPPMPQPRQQTVSVTVPSLRLRAVSSSSHQCDWCLYTFVQKSTLFLGENDLESGFFSYFFPILVSQVFQALVHTFFFLLLARTETRQSLHFLVPR